MRGLSDDKPTEAVAVRIATEFWGEPARDVQRFETGLQHWVYAVRRAGGASIVVRLGAADQHDDLAGAIHWSTTLRPMGVPLPALLGHGQSGGFPFMVLEHLPGKDLDAVYASLSPIQKRAVAAEVHRVQALVGQLPEGPGYGFVRLPQGPYKASWAEVIDGEIARFGKRIRKAGLVDPRSIQLVEEHALRFSSYFSRVRPVPFLDDATTKNVLVRAGVFTGIVDVDWIAFGDPLLTVAVTRTSLLSSGYDLIYTDHWLELLAPTVEQLAVVRFYTALYCLGFLSEIGRSFNREALAHSASHVLRLEELLQDNLERT